MDHEMRKERDDWVFAGTGVVHIERHEVVDLGIVYGLIEKF